MNALVKSNQEALVHSSALSPEYLRQVVEDFFKSLNERTRKTYLQGLQDFSAFAGENELLSAITGFLRLSNPEAHHLALRYQNHLKERNLAPSTINTRLAALRVLVRFGRSIGLITWSLQIKNIRSDSYRDTRGPGNAGYRALLKIASAQKPEKVARDIAILYLLHHMGLRRAEVTGLDLSDFDAKRGTLAVMGKRRTEKALLSIPKRTIEAVSTWLEYRGDAEGALFYNLHHDRSKRQRISGEGLRSLVSSLGKKAGIDVSPHGLRHLAITNVLDMGVGIREAQRFSRHADPSTLMKYDDNREDLAGKVAQRLEDFIC